MRGTTLEVAMLADVCEAHSAISSLPNVWLSPSDMSLRHSRCMSLTQIGPKKVNGAALESWWFDVDYELRCQFINYYDIP